MYKIAKLSKVKGLVHAFSTKEDGNMSFLSEKEAVVKKNRKLFLLKQNILAKKCVCLTVEHKTKIIEVSKKYWGRGVLDYRNAIKAEGLIVKRKNQYLMLLIADCLPLIIYNPKKKILALVHAGWRSLKLNIIEKTLKKIKEEYSEDLSGFIVAIGPSIHKKSYLFKNCLQKKNKTWRPFIHKESDGYYSIDLIGFATNRLIKYGILKRNIILSTIDTAKSRMFYSHYQSKINSMKKGRFICVVGMK